MRNVVVTATAAAMATAATNEQNAAAEKQTVSDAPVIIPVSVCVQILYTKGEFL